MCLGTCHMLFIRVGFYFSAFQILGVPYFVDNCKKTYMISIKNRYYRFNIIKALIIACMMFAIFRTNIQANVNEVVPYRTIFSYDKFIFTKDWEQIDWRHL